MIKIKSLATVLGVGLCTASAAHAQIPIEHIAKNPAFYSMSLSEDGTYISGLVTLEGEKDMSLAVWDAENLSKPPVVTPANDRMKFIGTNALKADKVFVIGQQTWTGNAGSYECLEGMTGAGSVKTFLIKAYLTDTKAKKFEEPFTKRSNIRDDALEKCFELSGEAGIAQNLPFSETDVIIRRTDTAKLVNEFYRVNLENDTEKLIYRETESTTVAYMNPRDGEILAKTQSEKKSGNDYDFQILIKQKNGEFELQEPLTVTAVKRQTMSIAGRDEKSGHYYVVTDKFSDKAALYFYDAEKEKFSDEPLFAHPEFNVTGVWLDDRPDTFNNLIGVTYAASQGKSYIIDPEWKAILDALSSANPGMDIDVQDYTKDLSKILYTVSSSTTPPSYFILKDKKVMLPIGKERPWFDSSQLKETELIYYTARDGLKIPGFLTLPKDWKKEDGPLPTVVLPHGGPWARDSDAWDMSGWPQFLASRGYAVLQPQYRGSQGWGYELWTAGDAEWGQAMQDDKDDGAAWLVSEGIAAPERIAIFGYSYGGFAAMAATVRENGPFKCAIAGAGVSNLTRIGNNWSDNRIQRAYQGRTVKGMDPLKNTDKANIPILIYHGDRDVRVPLHHATSFHNKIKDKVNSKLVVIDDMKHSMLWEPEHHRISLSAIEEFLRDDCQL
ncbi:alpha/beta hydrolase family protein [Hirschia maritima]|uniref:alpha/beta hydrolase family protein n=1 Tax=Hirschia maritima TaxID=1121961 RepID=UPI00036D9FD4|nr:prolyl oligopeptidase family serine peptidase [Hirschia maritima]